MNNINVIMPYNENGIWKFNDKIKGLEAEPFVGDMNKIIDQMVNDSLYVSGVNNFSVYFSNENFPGAEFVLTRDRFEMNGTWYRWGSSSNALEGWLCPATLKYFDNFPEKIFISLFTKN